MKNSSTENKKSSLKKIIFIILGVLILVTVITVCILGIVHKKEEEKIKREQQQQFEQSMSGGRIDNLQWSSRSSQKMNWDSAVSYCENLNEDGHDSWRLPNIDELRTTVKNCPKTENGGECKVSEKGDCLSSEKCGDKRSKGSCFCEYKKHNGGYYSKLGDPDGVWLWSSSVVSDEPNSRWRIGCSSGLVIHSNIATNFHVRCVLNAQ